MEESKIVRDYPVRVKLEQGQRGGYGWEISVSGDDEGDILSRVDRINESLKRNYKNEG